MKKRTRLTKKNRHTIVALRAKGMPFSIIAKKFGITETWARQVAFIEGKTVTVLPSETRSIPADLKTIATTLHEVARLTEMLSKAGVQMTTSFQMA